MKSWCLFPAAIFCAGVTATIASAQSPPPTVMLPAQVGVTQPLRDLQLRAPVDDIDTVDYRLALPRPFSSLRLPDIALQGTPGPLINATGGTHFDGLAANGHAPSDDNMAVGKNPAYNYILQTVNSRFAVYTKSGALVYGPNGLSSLWGPLGPSNGCATNNAGDVVAQYDTFEDRWLITQLGGTSSPYSECIAVSQTADPTGAYYLYSFAYSTTLNDYPKFGVWPTATNSAYLASYNLFTSSGSFIGGQLCAYDRAKMLKGDPTAAAVCYTINSDGGYLPADLDGATAPLNGSPGYFLNYETLSGLRIYALAPNFDKPNASTLTQMQPDISVAAFNEPCNGGGTCIPQSGTSQTLDSLGDRPMYRLAFRNFGDHEALVVNHSITTGAGVGVRWYELRAPVSSSAAFTLYQQGTFAPDTLDRWMGSAAMDGAGDIALGYSVSSTGINPGVNYTGRMPSDPSGTMESEASIIEGTGSQTSSLDRWGDYSSLRIDPADDCTFWYTNQYLKSNGNFNWSTVIGSFKFTSCMGSTTPDFSISSNPLSLTLNQGQAGSTTVTVASFNGFNSAVGVTVSGCPANTTCSMNPTSVTPAANGSATSQLTVTTSSTTPAGTVSLTNTGTGPATAHSTTIALTVNTGSIAPSAGTPQSTTIGTAFPIGLQATVKNSGGSAVSGAQVTFTAPSSGASAAFGGSATATAVTNSSGQATAPALTANNQAGGYTVTASVAGVATAASFSLTNTSATGSDLALGKIATQSSTLAGYGSGTAASSAVDGNTDGNFYDGSVSHTNQDASAWWQVDLGSSATISSLAIWSRTDCCSSRLSDYWVFVSNTPFLSTDTPATLQTRAGTWNSHQTSFPNPSSAIVVNAPGRYVRVQLSGTDYLSLAEVQVYGSSSGTTTYGISGQVTLSGAGLNGVTLTLSGSQSGSTTSSGSGSYSFTGLAAAGSYTVTPELSGYSFTPPSQTFNGLSANQTANFTAAAGQYQISGQVTLSGAGLNGVTVALSGSQSGSTTSSGSGSYSFTGLAAAGSYTVTPALSGYSFTPPSQTFNGLSANQTANFTAAAGQYQISGQVTLSRAGLNGVTVALSGSHSGSTSSSGSGNYSFNGLTAGTYTVTPSLSGYTFTPPSQTFTNLSASQTASFSASVVTTNSNLALGKTATQSSTLAGWGPSTVASSAVDGNTDGNFYDASVSHTNQDANAWWQVDLGSSATIGSITIWNRTDCCSTRLSDYWIFVSNTPFLSTDTPSTLQARSGTWNSHQTSYPNPSSTIAVNTQGRYVRVQLSGTDYLSLAEVQVFGSGSTTTTYGISGQVTLSGTGLNGVTVALSGSQGGSATTSGAGNYSLTGLAAAGSYTVTPSLSGYSFTPPSQTFNNLSANQIANFTATVVTTNSNLAVGKTASQSSTLSGFGPSTVAASAVDGNTDGNFYDGSVSHTNQDANAWWQVDLGSSATVTSVTIWNRTDCCMDRMSDYWVFVSNTPFLSSDTPATLQTRAGTWSSHQTSYPNPSSTIAVSTPGRYVRVQLSGTNYLSIGEVQVFGH